MNRARIALFLHLDRVTWEKGRWSSCWNPFPKPSIGQFGELRFRDYSDLSGSLLVAGATGRSLRRKLFSDQVSFHGAGRDLRDLIPSSIVKITLSCNLMKTQGEISWLGVWDSNQELAAASAWMAALVGWS
jgi:hypothetical protein